MKIPTVLTLKEMDSVERVVKEDVNGDQTDHNLFNAVRNYAVLRLLRMTGLRISEACGLELDEVFWEERSLKVRGKGGSERYQMLEDEATWAALKDYMVLRTAVVERRGSRRTELFLSFYGRKLLPREIQKALKKYGKRAGVLKNIYPHIYRHSYGTHMNWQFGLRITQEALRHESVQSTQIYTHVNNEQVREALKKAIL